MYKYTFTTLIYIAHTHTHKFLQDSLSSLDNINIKDNECPICLNTLSPRSVKLTGCNHVFCQHCILQSYEISNKCPCCRALLYIRIVPKKGKANYNTNRMTQDKAACAQQ